jgi:hypothetical protein
VGGVGGPPPASVFIFHFRFLVPHIHTLLAMRARKPTEMSGYLKGSCTARNVKITYGIQACNEPVRYSNLFGELAVTGI